MLCLAYGYLFFVFSFLNNSTPVSDIVCDTSVNNSNATKRWMYSQESEIFLLRF